MAQGFKDCPKSAILWADKLDNSSRVEQRGLIYHCKQACGPTLPSNLSYSLSLLHYKQRNYLRAARRLERSIQRHPKYGDSWILYFVCLYSHIFSFFLLKQAQDKKENIDEGNVLEVEEEKDQEEEEEGEDVSEIAQIEQYNGQNQDTEMNLQGNYILFYYYHFLFLLLIFFRTFI